MNLTIEKLVYGGDGLARLPADGHGKGKAVFVPFVLQGECVEASLTEQKPGLARGRAEQVVQPSPCRVEPHCPYFQRCGGCHYQHGSYEHQLEIKKAILEENLRRIAKLEATPELIIHASPPWNYRNRTRVKLRHQPEFALGYYRYNSHELLPIEQCPISSPLINRAIAACRELGRAGKMADIVQEIEFFADAADQELLLELYCLPETRRRSVRLFAEELKTALPEAAGVVAFKNGAENRGGSEPEQIVAAGETAITYETQSAAYRVSSGVFFQVNRHLIGDLLDIVTQRASGKIALDLYAGVGLFARVLSREFKQVVAVESSAIAHADLAYNCGANVKAVRAMAEQFLKNVGGKLQPDLVVVDPPRSGLGESVLHSLVTLGAPRLTYVSCDPATLSRDLGRLLRAGYQVEQAHLVDLFPQTYHLESVFRLVR